MDIAIGVQNLDEDVCVLHRANTFEKDIKTTILPPTMDK